MQFYIELQTSLKVFSFKSGASAKARLKIADFLLKNIIPFQLSDEFYIYNRQLRS